MAGSSNPSWRERSIAPTSIGFEPAVKIMPMPRFLGLLVLLPAAALAQTTPPASPGTALFNDQVRPLLVDKCLSCHAGEKPKGKLDLTQRNSALSGGEAGAAIVPGKPAESLLLEKVAEGEMPPKNPLKPEQVAAFRSWIE